MIGCTGLGERLTEEEIMLMLRYADRDGDGEIDYEEFAALILDM